ncbi:MAG: hypothetical protein JWM27_2202 [Gemmatimonadetes bacterium]|nr:hypothetical protein [Gemmatimonadota bacterium]
MLARADGSDQGPTDDARPGTPAVRPIQSAPSGAGRPRAPLDADTRDRIRAALEALDGVRRAVVDGSPLTVLLVCDATEGVPAEMAARAVLAQHGLRTQDVEMQVAYAPSPQARRRVRFVDARVEMPRVGRAKAVVELEWGGVLFSESMEGEGGPAMELRLVALATIRALESVMRGTLTFQLVGIKVVRAFDEDMAVAMLRADQLPDPSLVGASLSAGMPFRAASLAVLNSTNRFLGNYLANLNE